MSSLDVILDLYLEKKQFSLKGKKLYDHKGKLIVDGNKIRNYNFYTKSERNLGI